MEYRSILKKIASKDGKDKIPGRKEFLCALAKP